MNDFYVYGHYVDGNDTPFYIGKGKGNRAFEQYGRSQEWQEIVTTNNIKIKFLYESITEKEAFEMESKLIQEYGRIDIGTGCLINKTNGGDGVSGQVYTDKRREAIRKSASRSIIERLGDEKAKEFLEKQSKTRKEMYATGKLLPYWQGKHRDDTTKQKISKAKKGSTTSKKGKGKIVQHFDQNQNLISEYQSVAVASKHLNIPIHTIYTSIRRHGKIRNGNCFFKYK